MCANGRRLLTDEVTLRACFKVETHKINSGIHNILIQFHLTFSEAQLWSCTSPSYCVLQILIVNNAHVPPQIVFKLFRKLAVVKCCDFLSLILYRALLLNPMYYFVSWIQALVLPFFEILPSTFSKEIVLLPSGSEAFSFTKLLPVSLTPYSASLCGPEPHVTCVILMAHGLLHQGVSYLEGGKHISCSLWWSLSLA